MKNTNIKKGIKKEFNKKFAWIAVISNNLASEYGEHGDGKKELKTVWSFIEKTLDSTKEELKKNIKKMNIKDKGTVEARSIFGTCTIEVNSDRAVFYNQALSDVLKLLEDE